MKKTKAQSSANLKVTWVALVLLLQRTPTMPIAKHIAGVAGRIVSKVWTWRVAAPAMASVGSAPALDPIEKQTLAEDTTTTFQLSATDPENDSINFTADFDTSKVSVSIAGSDMTLVPALDWNGTTTIQVTANDGNGGAHTQEFELEVTPRNDPPVLIPVGNQTIDEDTSGTYTLSATDPESDPITFTATSSADTVAMLINGNSLTLQPDPDWFGTTTITISADDGNGGTAFSAFVLTVNPVDEPSPAYSWDGNAATTLSGNWKTSPWFGLFYDIGDGWVYHGKLGWLYIVGSDATSLWVYHPTLGWLFSGEGVLPYLYRHSGTWLYFQDIPGAPQLYEYNSNQWQLLE